MSITATDYAKRTFVVSNGTVTITLPEAGAAGAGREYRIGKLGSTPTVKVKAAGGDVIMSLGSVTLSTDQCITFVAADSTQWYKF
jgi:hypothetical protein